MYNEEYIKCGYESAMTMFEAYADEMLGVSDRDIYCKEVINEILRKMEEEIGEKA